MLVFPENPTPGQKFQRWQWDGEKWVVVGPTGFAPLDSPDFVGMPTAPTPPPGSNDAKLATTAFVQAAIAANTVGVASFNARTGHVVLLLQDIFDAGGAPINSPHFLGWPEANTAPPGTATRIIATTEFVTDAIRERLEHIVDSWNGRTGDVVLRWDDVEDVGGAPLRDPVFLGFPRGPTPPASDDSNRLATTQFVKRADDAIWDRVEEELEHSVRSFNQRTGHVVFRASDLSAVGGALLANPHFVGIPLAPTAPPHTHTDQIATTRYVDDAIASNPGPPGPPGQRGAEGPAGPAGQGLRIVGHVNHVSELPMHGQLGDVWTVGPNDEGFWWDGVKWVAMGEIKGPVGPQGPQGIQGVPGPLPTPVGPNGAIQFNDNGAWGARPDFWITPLGSLNVGRFVNVTFGGITLTDTPGGILFNSWPTNFIVAQQAGVHQWAVTLGNNDGNFSIDRYPTGVGGGPEPVLTIDFPTGRIIPNRNSLTAPSAISLQPRPFASLPAASLYWGGARATVNDALGSGAGGNGSPSGIVQGGGPFTVPVFCDGQFWRVMSIGESVLLNANNVMSPSGVIGWGTGNPSFSQGGIIIPGSFASFGSGQTNIYGQVNYWGGTIIFNTGATPTAVIFAHEAVSFTGLLTFDPGIAGRVWNNNGVLTISAG